MQNQEMKKAQRFIRVTFAVFCCFLLLICGFFFWLQNRPISPDLEIGALCEAVGDAYLAWIGDTCYEFVPSGALYGYCEFPDWKLVKGQTNGSHMLSLKLAEEYELAFYEDGLVKAYYGYSSPQYLDTAWYLIPEIVVEDISAYITMNGTIRQPFLGAASWFQTVK